MPVQSTLAPRSNAGSVHKLRLGGFDHTVIVSREDAVHFDYFWSVAYQIAQTRGIIILMVPNGSVADFIKVCIESAEANTLWAFARERILGIYWDIHQMAAAVKLYRQDPLNNELIVVRFISYMQACVTWDQFHLDKTASPIAFVGNGRAQFDNGTMDYESGLHKRSTVGGLLLHTWTFDNPSYRGIGCYGLGWHQTTAQTVADCAWDVAKYLAYALAMPILSATEGVNRAIWGDNAATHYIEDLKARVIAFTDVQHILKLDYPVARHGAASICPSYHTFNQTPGDRPTPTYTHSNSSSYGVPVTPEHIARGPSGGDCCRPVPDDPVPTRQAGKVRKFFRSLVTRKEGSSSSPER